MKAVAFNAFPRVRYADADGVRIAYEVRGHGAIDLVRVSAVFPSLAGRPVERSLGLDDDPICEFCRYVCFDRRGTGLSDPLLVGGASPLEQQVADLRAVMDAVGSQRAALWGAADGAQVALLFAAMYPRRVNALVLTNAFARWFRSDDYPIGPHAADRDRLARHILRHWGDLDNPWAIQPNASSRMNEPGFRELYALIQQLSASPSAAAATFLNSRNDVRDILQVVQAPTLVLYPEGTSNDSIEHSRFLVDHIERARLATYPGPDIYLPIYDTETVELVREFLTGARSGPTTDRELATVLFTDIVGSTEHLVASGDHRWHKSLDRHDAMIRAQLASFRGREISTAGDSFFAVFDGPARAIRCAQAIIVSARALGIDMRAGVHTGECEVRGDDYAGIAVHIGARIATLADAGEILTSNTVKDLVAGSGLAFLDHGLHDLKGVPEPWHLFRVPM